MSKVGLSVSEGVEDAFGLGRGTDRETLIWLGERLDQRLERGSARTVRELLAPMLLKIRDKKGCVRALELNAAQTKFEADCGQRNIMLKAHMCWLVGQGNEGKMQELEQRIKRQEISVYRLGGVGAALGGVLTIVHLALDYLKVMHR